MKAQLALVALCFAFLGASSQALAAKSVKGPGPAPLSCESDDLCLALPADAPETTLAAQAAPADKDSGLSAETKSMMVSDLKGGAVSIENEMILALAIDPISSEPTQPQALSEAVRAEEQVRSLETFLKSGIGAKGNLTVITTSKK